MSRTVIGCRSMVRSMCVRTKAPPGWITEHAKFRRPANDCTSLLWPSFSQESQKLGLCTVLFFFCRKAILYLNGTQFNLSTKTHKEIKLLLAYCLRSSSYQKSYNSEGEWNDSGTDIEGGFSRCAPPPPPPHPPPPPPQMTCSFLIQLVFWFSLLKFVYVISQIRHSPPWKNPGPPLWSMFNLSWATIPKHCWITHRTRTGQLMGMYLSHRAHGHECPPPFRGNWEETFIYLRTNLN